jgi:hypothetical protein
VRSRAQHPHAELSITRLSLYAKVVAIMLIVYLICEILLTPPASLETRPVANVTTTGYATLLFLFLGFLLGAVSLSRLLRDPRRSSMPAIAGFSQYFPAFLADQLGLFSSLVPPNPQGSLKNSSLS